MGLVLEPLNDWLESTFDRDGIDCASLFYVVEVANGAHRKALALMVNRSKFPDKCASAILRALLARNTRVRVIRAPAHQLCLCLIWWFVARASSLPLLSDCPFQRPGTPVSGQVPSKPRRNVSTHCQVEFVSSCSIRIPWASWSLRNGIVRPIYPMDEQLGWQLGDCNPCLDACKSSIRGRIRTDGAQSPLRFVPNLRPMHACRTEFLLPREKKLPGCPSSASVSLSYKRTFLPTTVSVQTGR